MFPALLAGRASCWGGCGGDERLLPREAPGLVLARGRDKRSLGKPLGARPCPFLLKAEGWHTYWVSFRAKGQHRFSGGLPDCLCRGQCLPQEGTCGPHADPPCTDRLGSEGGCHFCCQPCVLSQKVARGRCVLVRVTEGQRRVRRTKKEAGRAWVIHASGHAWGLWSQKVPVPRFLFFQPLQPISSFVYLGLSVPCYRGPVRCNVRHHVGPFRKHVHLTWTSWEQRPQ